MPLISISDAQRRPVWWADWRSTVYHGLPHDLLHSQDGRGKYLAFVGRFSPEKGADRAIELAKKVGIPIRLAAKVDAVDKKYFEHEIKPLLDHPLVEYVGEIDEHEKQEFLGNALALIFLIDWPEPFGLVMIESMACGTPVIAQRCGSVPEIVDEGATGFIVDGIEQAEEALNKIGSISRAECRRVFEKRFTASRMAKDYIAQFQALESDRFLSVVDVR
jgi:glycosyltransferase involved in cell wall biosynthesis